MRKIEKDLLRASLKRYFLLSTLENRDQSVCSSALTSSSSSRVQLVTEIKESSLPQIFMDGWEIIQT